MLGLGLGSRSGHGCGKRPHLLGAREDAGTSAEGLTVQVPAGSLHVLLQLLSVQSLQPADHGLVHGLQPLSVQVPKQQEDGSQDVVLGAQSYWLSATPSKARLPTP